MKNPKSVEDRVQAVLAGFVRPGVSDCVCASSSGSEEERRDEEGAAERNARGTETTEHDCGSETSKWRFQWDAFAPLLDMEHEIVGIDDDDDEPAGADRRAMRRLEVVSGLEVIESNPEDSGRSDQGVSSVLTVAGPPPGGLPPPPLVVEAPKPPKVAGVDIKAPKNPLPGAHDVVVPAPAPLKGIQTTDYWCPTDPDIWYSAYRWRRQKVGKKKCINTRPAEISRAFGLAYQMVRSAEMELADWKSLSVGDQKYLWQAYKSNPLSTLETWFGAFDGESFPERFAIVAETLASWSFRFRHGFHVTSAGFTLDIPVYIRCKSNENATASHAQLNVITLYGKWLDNESDKAPNNVSRALTMLHEMGHWARTSFIFPLASFNWISTYLIQDFWSADLDDRTDNDVCAGAKNEFGNRKCYRENINYIGDQQSGYTWVQGDWPYPGASPFSGDSMGLYKTYGDNGGTDPLNLVEKFNSDGEYAVTRTMLGNIDNYVCYMWNRWVDHAYCKLNTPD